MSGPRRVGILMPLAEQTGGAEALLLHLLTRSSRSFALHCLFLEDGPLVKRARDLGYPVELISVNRLIDAVNFLATMCAIRGWARRHQLAAVFSWMLKAHLYAAPALMFSSQRLFWFQHGIPSGQRMDRLGTRLPANGIFCCSAASKRAQDLLPPPRKTMVCYPGVMSPAGKLSKAEARERLGLDWEARIVGMISRWERWKGVHVFLDAIARAAPEDPRTHFFVVGGPHRRDPAYAQEIEAAAARLNLGSRLILAGQQTSEEVAVWLSSADLIVHPCTGTEPFGMAIVEAMAAGKPVIASDTGGIPEIISEGENGFLIAPGDSDRLASTMLALLGNPERLAAIGGRARERARSFSVDHFVQRFDFLLTEALAL